MPKSVFSNIVTAGIRVAGRYALAQIPPRNSNWASRGNWVHVAKIGFEKYFLRKVRNGQTEPLYEKFMLKLMGATVTEQV